MLGLEVAVGREDMGRKGARWGLWGIGGLSCCGRFQEIFLDIRRVTDGWEDDI